MQRAESAAMEWTHRSSFSVLAALHIGQHRAPRSAESRTAALARAGTTETHNDTATDRSTPMFTRSLRASRALALVIAVAAIGLLAASCGDDDVDPAREGGALTTPTGGAEDDHAAEEGEDDHADFAFGEPAEPADATETVQVSMNDDFTYEPPSITVPVGETVLFEVTNDGAIVHEFTLGDHELQLEHEEEMAEMEGGMMMQDEPNAIAVEPGETKELAFTFTEAGSLEYACHEPGHYDAGMIGELVVE